MFVIFPIYNALALTVQDAATILSTGNVNGQPATQAQLNEAYSTYYGTYYNNLPNVDSNTSINSNSNDTTEPTRCTGDPRQNASDAFACKQIAETEGRARGLNISCQVSLVTYPSTGPDTGSGYYYNIPCSVNGSSGHDAVLLAGYSGTALTNPNINPTWSLFTSATPTNTNTGTNSGTNTNTGSGFSSANTNYPATISGVVSAQVNAAKNALSFINSGSSSYTLPTFTVPTSPITPTTNSTATNNNTCQRINSSLRMGDSGAEVALLTAELVKEGLLSQPKTTFDTQVYNAVIAYQEKYASYILSPVGLTRGSGFVGPSTLSFMNSKMTCSSSTTGGSTTGGSTTGGNTTTSGLQGQISSLQALIDSLLAQLNGTGSTGGTGSTNTGGTVTIPTTFSANKTITGPISFRYLKIDTKSRSWIAWREIEVYDLQGNKITPTTGQVSCEWCNNNYFRDSNSGGADKTYDGNVMTAWNAGETAPGCNWSILSQTIDACIAANIDNTRMNRVGWIVLDYGSVKNVSKIRMMTESDPNPANAQHVISVGNSSNPSNQIAAFGGQVPAGTWIEIVVQ